MQTLNFHFWNLWKQPSSNAHWLVVTSNEGQTGPDTTGQARGCQAGKGRAGYHLVGTARRQAAYAIVCEDDQKRLGRHSAMLRTRVLLVYIDTECSVLPSPARHYLTIPGPVRSCQALSDSLWPCLSCLALLGPVRPCLAPSGPAWRCPAQPCPVLHDPALPIPVRPCSSLPGPVRPCPAIPVHRCPFLSNCPSLPDPVQLCPARPCSSPPGPTLIGSARPGPGRHCPALSGLLKWF